MKIYIHYAFQLCDIANREHNKRICGTDRTLLSKKSVLSFLYSVQYCCSKFPESIHTIKFFSDRSTDHLVSFVKQSIEQFACDNIRFEFESLQDPGIDNSILKCYQWLSLQGREFVYQVQDDYLFTLTTIQEMVDLQLQLKNEIGEYVIISPYNDSWLWKGPYRNKVTPRVVICSRHRYWIQYYDMSCSFMIHHHEFTKHWDVYNLFFKLLKDLPTSKTNDLENKSLNYLLTQKGILGLVPVNTLAFHMQSELEEDPYIDWKPYWEQLNVE